MNKERAISDLENLIQEIKEDKVTNIFFLLVKDDGSVFDFRHIEDCSATFIIGALEVVQKDIIDQQIRITHHEDADDKPILN